VPTVAVINVLYLPRDDKLRTLVRTALDFVEEIYKPEFLAGIRFVSFDPDDGVDVERVKVIAGRERFTDVVEHEGCKFKPVIPAFVLPHSDFNDRYAWIPVSSGFGAPLILDVVAHELTHLAFDRLPDSDKAPLYWAFLRDVNLAEIVTKTRLPTWLIGMINEAFSEIVALYIVDNYFVGLERTSKTPTLTSKTLLVAIGYMLALSEMRIPESLARILATMYYKIGYRDLVEFRKEVHGIFTKMIKKLPADVLESNRAKYGILYRG
jgi:hypothetical protein